MGVRICSPSTSINQWQVGYHRSQSSILLPHSDTLAFTGCFPPRSSLQCDHGLAHLSSTIHPQSFLLIRLGTPSQSSHSGEWEIAKMSWPPVTNHRTISRMHTHLDERQSCTGHLFFWRMRAPSRLSFRLSWQHNPRASAHEILLLSATAIWLLSSFAPGNGVPKQCPPHSQPVCVQPTHTSKQLKHNLHMVK